MSEKKDSKPLILIVDDVARNLQLLGSVLFENGYEVAMADSGPIALDMMREIKPELILLDIMMPEMDGYEVCQTLKSQSETKEIPIVFLTAKTETDDIVRGFKLGASDYVSKPFRTEELLSRVGSRVDLARKTRKLKELNETLEEKVRERTARLEQAYIRLAKLDGAKNYFLSLLSHELNTPLSGISGFANILKMDVENDELRGYCDNILDSTDRLLRFADLSLLITRLRAEKYEMNLENVSLEEIAREVSFNLSENAAEKGVEFINDYEKETPNINGDRYLLRKVVENVWLNAIKYSPTNAVVEVRIYKDDGEIVLETKDKGPGFKKEQMDSLFDFFASDELMHHQEGLGLGMAASKIIMTEHGGKIVAGNNKDVGAFVRLHFIAD